MSEQITLGDAFPIELNRCRKLIEQYESIGPVGQFGKFMIGQVIERAEFAQQNNDTVAMLRSYQEMKSCK